MASPLAPISHHWLDATHIAFGVVTGGIVAYDTGLKHTLLGVSAELLARDGRDKSALPFVASPLGRARATMELVRNAKLSKLLWAEESERLLRLVSEVARRVPVYTLEVPRDLDLLPQVVDQLLEWHAAPQPQPA